MAVEWDGIELPSLLHERWLLNRALLQRFCRHYETQEPLPAALIEALEAMHAYDRPFTLSLDALSATIVDIRLHQLRPGDSCAALEVEQQVFDELGMPSALDLIQHAPASFHLFGGGYAAGFYSYLWSDVMAVDASEALFQGDKIDPAAAERYARTILSVGSSVPANQAFRNFRDRDPNPEILLRRYGLAG